MRSKRTLQSRARAIVAQQTQFVVHDRLIEARCCQSQSNRVRHILSPYVRAEFPGDDVAAEVVQDRVEIMPAPADDLEISEVGLSHLGDGGGLVRELVGRFDHHIVRCRD